MPWAGLCGAWHQPLAPRGRRVAILLGRPPVSLAIAGFLGCDLDNVFSLLNKPSGKRDCNFERAGFNCPTSFHTQPPPHPPRARPRVSRPTGSPVACPSWALGKGWEQGPLATGATLSSHFRFLTAHVQAHRTFSEHLLCADRGQVPPGLIVTPKPQPPQPLRGRHSGKMAGLGFKAGSIHPLNLPSCG